MSEFYKKHRPQSLDRVVGNSGTIASLRNMIERKTLPHSLLFTGPSGCGKTTLARIVTKELQCHDLDYAEINSSSFRGIDTIRDIQRLMNLAPAAGPVRVWLLDEVHKLSNDAQNSALKMLEDTPSHVYFLLCTTDPQKLIKAIITRCTEMPVKALTYDELKMLVERVARKEGLKISAKIVDDLVASAQGSARTLLVLLEKIAHLSEDQQAKAIADKLAEENEAIELCRALIAKKPWRTVTSILQNLKGEPEEIRWAVLGYAKSVMLKSDQQGAYQAYLVADCFRDNFYDSKHAGLVLACYTAITAK